MLEHVGQTGLVDGVGEERQVEDAVGVVIGDVHQLRACLLMLEQHDLRADQREFPGVDGFKSADHIAHPGQGVSRFLRERGRHRGQQHAQAEQQGKHSLHSDLL